MRINKYVAQATGLSRRSADRAISDGRISINSKVATLGANVTVSDIVAIDDKPIESSAKTTILLNKPAGYVTSRKGQGSQTIYDLLPKKYQKLKPVGRLDKNSSGLLLLTNDGDLANLLTHPKHSKVKVYKIILNQPLEPLHKQMISKRGVNLKDGISKLELSQLGGDNLNWQVTMREGRNRQIRRTFESIGYKVTGLHRIKFGPYELGKLASGKTIVQ